MAKVQPEKETLTPEVQAAPAVVDQAPVEVEPAPVAEVITAADVTPAAEPAPVVDTDWPKFLKSATSFSYTDPVTKIRYSPNSPVRIDAAPKKGSWLDCQMAAKLIVKV